MKIQIATALAFVVCACRVTNPSPMHRDREDHRSEVIARTVVTDANLAPSEPPGSVTIVSEPIREVDGVSSGRAWLLELYQGVLVEKDELARRVEASERSLVESQAATAALTAEHEAVKARCAEFERRVRELEKQSLDLAQRLAESEIARLEAQKAELERESRTDRKERP